MHAFCLLVNMTVEQYITTIYIYGCIQLNVIKSLTNKYIASFFGWIFWWSTILSLLNSCEWVAWNFMIYNIKLMFSSNTKMHVFCQLAQLAIVIFIKYKIFSRFQTTLPCDETYCNAINTIHCILHVLLRYFHLTTFFWMFVEGTYKRILIDIYTYKMYWNNEQDCICFYLCKQHLPLVDWNCGIVSLLDGVCIDLKSYLDFVIIHSMPGVPSLLTLLWTLLIYCQAQSEVFQESGSGQHLVKSPVNESLLKCPFMVESEANMYNVWTYTVPVCLLLACNFVFSIWIMSVREAFKK